MDEDVVLRAVGNAGEVWTAEISFRGKQWTMQFGLDRTGRLRHQGRSPFALTVEGYEVCALVDRVRRGEALQLPCRVEVGDTGPRLPSVHDPSWSDWSVDPCVKEVWLDAAERVGSHHWSARLRVDGRIEPYELEILPGPILHELQGPKVPGFQSFTYDLHGLLLRMDDGERFALPFKLRPRWPTPPDPPAVV